MYVALCALTLHCESDGLTGFVLPVLVIHGLGIVPSCIWGHSGQDDQCVVQSDGTDEEELERQNKTNKQEKKTTLNADLSLSL